MELQEVLAPTSMNCSILKLVSWFLFAKKYINYSVIWTPHKPKSPAQTQADTKHRQRQLEHRFAHILVYQCTFHPWGNSNPFHILLIFVLPPERQRLFFQASYSDGS